MQKRLAASVMKCGRRKVWMDPNEGSEIAMANTRVMIRKLIRDGFVIRKPKKIHSRFRARRRRVEKKRGRHLGLGTRSGTANARCSTKMLWMKRQRAMRRLLRRYYTAGKIDRKMYHRYYLRAKGNTFKNKASLIERIDVELTEKKRSQQLLEQYKIRREEAMARKAEREKKKQELLDEQLKLVEEAEKIRIKQEKAKKRRERQKGKGKGSKDTPGGDDDGDEPMDDGGAKKRKRKRKKKGGGQAEEASPQQQKKQPKGKKGGQKKPEKQQSAGQDAEKKKRRRRRKKGGGGGDE